MRTNCYIGGEEPRLGDLVECVDASGALAAVVGRRGFVKKLTFNIGGCISVTEGVFCYPYRFKLIAREEDVDHHRYASGEKPEIGDVVKCLTICPGTKHVVDREYTVSFLTGDHGVLVYSDQELWVGGMYASHYRLLKRAEKPKTYGSDINVGQYRNTDEPPRVGDIVEVADYELNHEPFSPKIGERQVVTALDGRSVRVCSANRLTDDPRPSIVYYTARFNLISRAAFEPVKELVMCVDTTGPWNTTGLLKGALYEVVSREPDLVKLKGMEGTWYAASRFEVVATNQCPQAEDAKELVAVDVQAAEIKALKSGIQTLEWDLNNANDAKRWKDNEINRVKKLYDDRGLEIFALQQKLKKIRELA